MKNKWIYLGLFLCLNIVGDSYMTDLALSQGGFYETNQFTNIVGVQAHMILLLGVASLLTISANKGVTISKGFLILASIIWTINNFVSLGLLF